MRSFIVLCILCFVAGCQSQFLSRYIPTFAPSEGGQVSLVGTTQADLQAAPRAVGLEGLIETSATKQHQGSGLEITALSLIEAPDELEAEVIRVFRDTDVDSVVTLKNHFTLSPDGKRLMVATQALTYKRKDHIDTDALLSASERTLIFESDYLADQTDIDEELRRGADHVGYLLNLDWSTRALAASDESQLDEYRLTGKDGVISTVKGRFITEHDGNQVFRSTKGDLFSVPRRQLLIASIQ